MIRPFTCVCFLLACGSGLYLYQAKHRVQMIDREIEKTVRTTEELRGQIRVLHAEWTLQSDPQRLQGLADQFLSLKTVAPGQFTSMADLDNRLPAVRAPEPAPSEVQSVPVAGAEQPEEPIAVPAPVIPVPPPKPAVVAAVAAPTPRPLEHKQAPRPAIVEAQPARQPPPTARPVIATEQPRPVLPVSASLPTPMPASGSALGMARTTSPPPPRPMPVSASQWMNSGGGG
ncbi:MAG TPA: hypothetical protein VGI78_21420 [Acetobacteraceae bacterium]|jgi:hypothetical protein